MTDRDRDSFRTRFWRPLRLLWSHGGWHGGCKRGQDRNPVRTRFLELLRLLWSHGSWRRGLKRDPYRDPFGTLFLQLLRLLWSHGGRLYGMYTYRIRNTFFAATAPVVVARAVDKETQFEDGFWSYCACCARTAVGSGVGSAVDFKLPEGGREYILIRNRDRGQVTTFERIIRCSVTLPPTQPTT